MEEVLPGRDVGAFLRKARTHAESYVDQSVDASFEAIEKDVADISDDAWATLKSLKDPVKFGQQYNRMLKKWSPYHTWRYMLSEDDPSQGMRKAAFAYGRQLQLFRRYATPAGIPASLMKAGVMAVALEEAKKLMGSFKTEAERKAFSAMVAAVMADLQLDRATEIASHPFYRSGKLRGYAPEEVWTDSGSGGDHDWSLWRPNAAHKLPGGRRRCISLGDYAHKGHSKPPGALNVVCNVGYGKGKWWAYPIDYKLVWSDKCSGAKKDGSIWAPVCPEGYSSVGFVAGGRASQLPSLHNIACLQNDERIFRMLDGKSAGLSWKMDDQGSGAKFNVSLFGNEFAGIKMMFATPEYTRDPSHLRVPVSWGEPGKIASWAADYSRFVKINRKPEAAKPSTIRPSGVIQFRNRHSLTCIDKGATSANGAAVTSQACSTETPSQFFRLEAVKVSPSNAPAGIGQALWNQIRISSSLMASLSKRNGKTYHLISESSKKCIDVPRAELRDGQALHQWSCHRAANQAWTMEPTGDNHYRFRSARSGKCLDLRGGNKAAGTRFQQTTCKPGNPNQEFTIF